MRIVPSSLAAILLCLWPTALLAQGGSVLHVDGGVRFPDGTVQFSAVVNPGQVPVTGQTVSVHSGDDGDLRTGVKPPAPRFLDNGDGTATDRLTGLVWMRDMSCMGTSRTWEDSLTQIENLNEGSEFGCTGYSAAAYDDWRLANVKELASLLDYGQFPALPAGHPFVNAVDWYWTSTSRTGTNDRFIVGFSDGHVISDSDLSDYAVLPVRGGQ